MKVREREDQCERVNYDMDLVEKQNGGGGNMRREEKRKEGREGKISKIDK